MSSEAGNEVITTRLNATITNKIIDEIQIDKLLNLLFFSFDFHEGSTTKFHL